MTATLTRRFFLLLTAVLFLSASPAFAGDAASDFVQSMGNKALSSLTAKDIPGKEREGRVRNLLQNNFDVHAIAKFALGPYWRSATDAQKAEYNNLFEDMIVKTYSQRFSEYSGQAFKVTGALQDGKDSLVNSQIIQQGGPPVNVKWRVRNNGGGYKVVDVIVEDISMSVTQRSDFASVIEGGGGKLEVLLDSLRKRKIVAK